MTLSPKSIANIFQQLPFDESDDDFNTAHCSDEDYTQIGCRSSSSSDNEYYQQTTTSSSDSYAALPRNVSLLKSKNGTA